MDKWLVTAGGVCTILLLLGTALSFAATALPAWSILDIADVGLFELCEHKINSVRPCYEIHSYLEERTALNLIDSQSWIRGCSATMILCLLLNICGLLLCVVYLSACKQSRSWLLATVGGVALFAGFFGALTCGLWTRVFASNSYGSSMWLAVCTVFIDFIVFIIALVFYVMNWHKQNTNEHDTSYYTQHSGTYYVPPPTITEETQEDIIRNNKATGRKVSRQNSSASKHSRVSVASSKHSKHSHPAHSRVKRSFERPELYLRVDNLGATDGRLSQNSSVHSRGSRQRPGYPTPMRKEDNLKITWDRTQEANTNV